MTATGVQRLAIPDLAMLEHRQKAATKISTNEIFGKMRRARLKYFS